MVAPIAEPVAVSKVTVGSKLWHVEWKDVKVLELHCNTQFVDCARLEVLSSGEIKHSAIERNLYLRDPEKEEKAAEPPQQQRAQDSEPIQEMAEGPSLDAQAAPQDSTFVAQDPQVNVGQKVGTNCTPVSVPGLVTWLVLVHRINNLVRSRPG